MKKIIINPHNCSREELAELKEYLENNCWDFKEEEPEPEVNARDLRKEIESQLLKDMYPAIGIDKPRNHDDIVEFIFHDVEITADPFEWHSGDISIGFRRYIESVSE